jgi:acyl-CoA dehydrogenase
MADAAADQAEMVDAETRFPDQAMEVARRERLLGCQVPVDLGGEGASIAELSDICYALGRACASTGMIFAMHQTKVACLVRHGGAWHQRLLRRIAADQLLLASSTTEGNAGGDIRRSAAAVAREGDRISLIRDATVISYGAQADGIVTTARRAGDAAGSDQVLLAMTKEDYELAPTIGWRTLGMRGTCSAGFRLRFEGASEQILPEPYERIHARTMTPVAHLLWGSVWAGIAAAAVTRAQAFIRRAARGSAGAMPPGAAHLTQARMSLDALRGLLGAGLAAFERSGQDGSSFEFESSVTLLKVKASELAVEAVMHAARSCGLAGYREDGEFSMARLLRDALSAPIMINNDRILANAAAASLMAAVPSAVTA